MKPKNYSKEDVLNGVLLGIEFEFYSKLDNKEVARSLSKEIGKRVVIPYTIPALGSASKPLYHSPIEVTNNIFKLEPDYSGGLEMYELVTGPMDYKDAKDVIVKVLNWIDKFGYTNDRCSIHLNISFNADKVEALSSIDKLDVMKFVLAFDEKFIYDRFPTRKGSVYARTIRSIIPNSFFFYNSPPADFDVADNFNTPEEKYFGVNFTKREKNYLEFRYIGGKDYEKKSKKVLECLDHIALQFFSILNSTGYTEMEKTEIRRIYNTHRDLVKVFNDYSDFHAKYPDIKVTVDLKDNEQIIKSFWNSIRMDIFGLMVNSGLKKGKYNYDTDFGTKQLMGAKLDKAILSDYELIDCEIEGYIFRSDLYMCTIKESRLLECQALKENTFENCKLQMVLLNPTNKAIDCYIENKNMMINCFVDGGVIRSGEIGSLAEVSEKTKIVESGGNVQSGAAPTQKEAKPEIKDWRWIKSLKK
jgi:hypothetical protein